MRPQSYATTQWIIARLIHVRLLEMMTTFPGAFAIKLQPRCFQVLLPKRTLELAGNPSRGREIFNKELIP